MTNRKPAALVASVAKDETSINRIDIITRLSAANAQERILILTALPMGEIASIGGKVAGIGASVNEALNIKLVERHGADWVAIAKALPSTLCDADKERRKAINASLESIRESIKANAGGDAAQAANTIRRIKEWGEGKRQSKSAPNANKKAAIKDFLLSWDALPSIYRRLMKDEGSQDAEMQLGDAIAAYFKAEKISAAAVLACTGKSAWNK